LSYPEYNDYELIDMIAESNEIAERTIFDKYLPLVISKAKKYYPIVKNKGVEMNDLIQEGMIGLNEAIKNYKDNREAQFKTFANLCVEREIQSYITKNNRQKHYYLNNAVSLNNVLENGESTFMEFIADSKADPIDHLIDQDYIQNILSKLNEVLSDIEKEVFNLKLANFSYQEIATLLDKKPKAIDNTLQRIKIKIRKIMDEDWHRLVFMLYLAWTRIGVFILRKNEVYYDKGIFCRSKKRIFKN